MPGTVCPADDFDAGAVAEKLREAMCGIGTDEETVLQILGNHSNDQRLEIADAFKVAYGKDLIEDIKDELGGDFEDLCVALLTSPRLYDAKQLHEAMSGAGTDETALVEIMVTRNNSEIEEIKEKYKEEYDTELEEDLKSDTSGYFRRLLVSLCVGGRESDEWEWSDEDKAREDAEKFKAAGADVWGTEEAELNAILCLTSPGQLRKVIEVYEELSDGVTMEEAIRNECSGALKEGYLAIVESVKSKPNYFARRLHDSMAGFGTSDSDLIRIIVSRSEIDMEEIEEAYESAYEKTLVEAVESECSGDYKRLLKAILTPP
ncbi:annexin B9-like [Babylonia areolata]|uniref:annexin B9-like n=1 Tax=Babylonia areolata TaxID=304850 RepID=UPI003FCFE32B